MKNKAMLMIATYLMLFFFATITYAAYEQEPNNTSATANNVPIDQSEYIGQLYSGDDLDYFKTTSAIPGVLEVSIRPENSNYDGGSIIFSIMDSGFNVLSSRKVGSDSKGFVLRASIDAGVYYLLIKKNDGYKIFTKNYIFSLSLNQTIKYEAEVNDTIDNATMVNIASGEYRGQLRDGADLDYFEVDNLETGVLEMNLRPENSNYDGGSIQVSILNSQQVKLVTRTLGSDSDTIQVSATVEVGKYYILFTKRDSYKIFDKEYIFSLAINKTAIRELEPNDSVITANALPPINSGISISGNVSSTDDIDMYSLSINELSIIKCSVEPENKSYDGGVIFAQLVDQQGNIYAARKISSDGGLTDVKATLPPGIYYLKLAKYDNIKITSKDYSIIATSSNDDQEIKEREQEQNNHYGVENTKIFNQTIIGQLSSNDDVDIYRLVSDFTGFVKYTFGPKLLAYDGGAIGLSVVNEDGEIVVTRPAGSDYENTITFYSIKDKMYYLIVREYYDLFAYFGPAYLKIFDKDYYIISEYPVSYKYETEFNDDCGKALNVSMYDSLFALINVYEDIDCYPITMLNGGFAELQISPIYSSYDGGALQATLMNSNGDIIASKSINSDAAAPISLVLYNASIGKYFLKMSRVEGIRLINDREYYVHFMVDSDGDSLVNTVDNDDDNDGISDIIDTFPLDPDNTSEICENGELVINKSFGPGRHLNAATHSITTTGIVQIPVGADVTFQAPVVRLQPGFKVSTGANLKIQSQAVTCASPAATIELVPSDFQTPIQFNDDWSQENNSLNLFTLPAWINDLLIVLGVDIDLLNHTRLGNTHEWIVFETMQDLLPSDDNKTSDIYRLDLTTRNILLISHNPEAKAGNAASRYPAVDASGDIIVFQSDASDLTPHDTNDITDIFIHDLSLGVTRRITEFSNGASAHPAIDSIGENIIYDQHDNEGRRHILLSNPVDLYEPEILSLKDNDRGDSFDNHHPAISGDARFVAYLEQVQIEGTHTCHVHFFDRHNDVFSRQACPFELAAASENSRPYFDATSEWLEWHISERATTLNLLNPLCKQSAEYK